MKKILLAVIAASALSPSSASAQDVALHPCPENDPVSAGAACHNPYNSQITCYAWVYVDLARVQEVGEQRVCVYIAPGSDQ